MPDAVARIMSSGPPSLVGQVLPVLGRWDDPRLADVVLSQYPKLTPEVAGWTPDGRWILYWRGPVSKNGGPLDAVPATAERIEVAPVVSRNVIRSEKWIFDCTPMRPASR